MLFSWLVHFLLILMPPNQYFHRDTISRRIANKAKDDLSPHEMRLSLTGHQPSIFWSRGSRPGNIIVIIIIIIIIIIIMIIIIIIIIVVIIIVIIIIINIIGRLSLLSQQSLLIAG